MPWRGHNGQNCKVCGRHVSVCGELSARYKCHECGQRRSDDNMEQLVGRRGPFFEHWYRACRAAFEFERVDDGRAKA